MVGSADFFERFEVVTPKSLTGAQFLFVFIRSCSMVWFNMFASAVGAARVLALVRVVKSQNLIFSWMVFASKHFFLRRIATNWVSWVS